MLGFHSCLGFKEEKIRDPHLLQDFPGLEELENRIGNNDEHHAQFSCRNLPSLMDFFFYLFFTNSHNDLQSVVAD